jgi:hypothetical protein
MSVPLRAEIEKLAKIFPPANYGFSQVALHGQAAKSAAGMVIRLGRERPCFDCASASRQVCSTLNERGWQASILGVKIPVVGEEVYNHCLVLAETKREKYLIDFTPFGRILGLDPCQQIFLLTLKHLYRNFQPATIIPVGSAEQTLEINKCLGRLFFPFSDNGKILTEFGFQYLIESFELTLRISQLRLMEDGKSLTRTAWLGYRATFSSRDLSSPVKPNLNEEMRLAKERWQITNQAGIGFEAEAAANWPAFARLVNLLRENIFTHN